MAGGGVVVVCCVGIFVLDAVAAVSAAAATLGAAAFRVAAALELLPGRLEAALLPRLFFFLFFLLAMVERSGRC